MSKLFFSAVDLIQHKYLVILYNKIKLSITTCANKDKYDQSAINYINTLIYLNPALKPMAASTGKSFGLKLYIHSMTDNIITTSNYTQLQLNELPGYNLNIVENGVKHPKKNYI
jgi:translation initiation factor 2 gamma subunit (eIF-2gamma)